MGFRGFVIGGICLLGFARSIPVHAYIAPQADEVVPDYVFAQYIDSIRQAAVPYYLRWQEMLLGKIPGTRHLGLSFHDSPLQRPHPKAWRFWLSGPPEAPLWKSQKDAIAWIAREIREDQGIAEQVGFRFYLWTEPQFLAFEDVLLTRLEDEASEFDRQIQIFHDRHSPPTNYELEPLLEHYLDIWVLAAVLSVENDRYLQAFPYKGSHPDNLYERQASRADAVHDCRGALIRMLNPRYRW